MHAGDVGQGACAACCGSERRGARCPHDAEAGLVACTALALLETPAKPLSAIMKRAFEPCDNHDWCHEGGMPRTQVHPVAVSDTPGEALLKSDCNEDCSLRVFKHDQTVGPTVYYTSLHEVGVRSPAYVAADSRAKKGFSFSWHSCLCRLLTTK